MLVVTMGGWESHYSERGVNGPIQDLLFPINHGILHYPGFDVMQPFLLYKVHSMDEESFSHNCEELGKRLDNLWTDQPIAYRKQNGGDYEIPALRLRPKERLPLTPDALNWRGRFPLIQLLTLTATRSLTH
jgi:NAD(P)H dehydrogenase (quinone)